MAFKTVVVELEPMLADTLDLRLKRDLERPQSPQHRANLRWENMPSLPNKQCDDFVVLNLD